MYQHESWVENSDFVPIPALFNPNGDTYLIFLSSNGIEFWDKTDDPWYRATVPGDRVYTQNISEGIVVYQPEEAASPLGCVSQYQFCNPSLSSNNCGPLVSWSDVQRESASLFGITTEDWDDGVFPTTSNTMGSRFVWLTQVLGLGQASIPSLIMQLGQDALTSLKYFNSGTMGPLPIDQWQLDVRYWWATYLASVQTAVVDTAHGPTDPELTPYKVLPFNSHGRDMCNNQVLYPALHAYGLQLTRDFQI